MINFKNTSLVGALVFGIISLFSEKRCYNPVTEWNNFDFWRKWQAAVSEKTKKRRPKVTYA